MATSNPSVQFVEHVMTSLANQTFVLLSLSARKATADLPDRILGRLIELRGAPHLSLTYRYPTRDVTKNLPVPAVADWLREQLAGPYRSALLRTTLRDWQLSLPGKLIAHKPAATASPSRAHDHAKESVLDDSAQTWLHGLGLTDAAGKVRVSMADKYRQMNRYLEIFTHLTRDIPLQTIADMGCGKGYLTFGMWHLFRHQPIRIIGVEQRPALVAGANDLARRVGATGLEFVAGTIESVRLPTVDALIALHACNTATDDAINRGIAAHAKLIIVAPCCHQELRPQLGRPAPLAPALDHGLMAERMAEWVTDSLRVLHLEAAGYRTKAIEFVGSEHTPKNLMIAAVYDRPAPPSARERIVAFKSFFGIGSTALDRRLE